MPRVSPTSQPGITAAGIAFALLDPDPTIEWGAERLVLVRHALEGLAPPPHGGGRIHPVVGPSVGALA
jgi:hypothetical protein